MYWWTECTDNSAHQALMSGQVASLHVWQKNCGDSPGFTSKIWRKFCANIGKILYTSEANLKYFCRKIKRFNFYVEIDKFYCKTSLNHWKSFPL